MSSTKSTARCEANFFSGLFLTNWKSNLNDNYFYVQIAFYNFQMISIKEGAGDIDIGANASAEGEDADDGPAEEGMITV